MAEEPAPPQVANNDRNASSVAARSSNSPERARPAKSGPAQIQEIEVEGKIVCVPERIHELYQSELPTGHEHIFGFETGKGAIFTLLRAKFSEALFADERLRDKRLLLKGRTFPNTHVLEVTRIRSIKDGVVHDLFYYCSVCSIETVLPGECACCQGSVELVEKPLPKNGSRPGM